LLSLPTWNVNTWPDSSAGPALMPVAQPATLWAPASSSTVWSEPAVNDGTSFTAVTVIVNVWSALVSTPPLAVPPSSLRLTVTVAEPFASAAGV